jgi:polar amino acid transport system permease protein
VIPASSSTAQGHSKGEIVTGPLRARPHPWRWIVGAVLVAILVGLCAAIARSDALQWAVVAEYLCSPIILSGLWATLWLTAVAILLGFLIGTGLAMARLSRNPVVQGCAWAYIWFFRSVPLLVLILFAFNIAYLFPQIIIGLPFHAPLLSMATNDLVTPMAAALLALTVHESAYAAEIVRGGILAVDQGQFEAATSLGLNARQTMMRIIIPQAMRAIIPSAGNQLIGLLKGTSMVSVIAVGDLLYSAQSIYSRNFQVVPLLVVATIWYIVVTTILSVLQYYVERHFSQGAVRDLPTPTGTRVRAHLVSLFARVEK